MKEDFIHYVWKYQKFDPSVIQTVNEESVEILNVGMHNQYSGPDFFNARLRVADQQWAGNVEIHLKSSDWYAHHHEVDPAYDNVILHLVWEHDIDVFRKDGTVIPTVVLKEIVDVLVLENYKKLLDKPTPKWINCDTQLQDVPAFLINHWKERLYFERLEQKSTQIETLLATTHNDWETVLFQLLTKNFGLVVNGDAFRSLGSSLEFSVIRKCSDSVEELEALLFGQAGLLDGVVEEPYFEDLRLRYEYQKHKYQLDASGVLPVQFFRLRPPNFPTIRISQLANLYSNTNKLFTQLMECKTIEAFYKIFDVTTSVFWETHYTFEKKSTKRKKKLTRSFIDLLLINTIIPLRFCYEKHIGKNSENIILQFVEAIGAEKNGIIDKFNTLGIESLNAMHSQAIVQLKKKYCDTNACMQCAIGNHLLAQK